MSYWDEERPLEATTGVNVLQYFSSARKLHISKMPWKDKAGASHRGKTVALDIEAAAQDDQAANIVYAVAEQVRFLRGE